MKWIKCSEKLPGKKIKLFLTFEYIEHIKTKEKIPMICLDERIFRHKGKYITDAGGENITHWMPLPPIPEELDV